MSVLDVRLRIITLQKNQFLIIIKNTYFALINAKITLNGISTVRILLMRCFRITFLRVADKLFIAQLALSR